MSSCRIADKSPLLAFTLSFLLPGAGLVYLGKPFWGMLNFLIVLVIGGLAYVLLDENAFAQTQRYLAFGCSGGSAGLARAFVQQAIKNQEKELAEASARFRAGQSR